MKTITVSEIDSALHDLIEKLFKDGMKVYTKKYDSSPGPIPYIYYTDGRHIAYAQVAYLGCIAFSTVHKPNPNTGTGYSLGTAVVNYADAFHPPRWASLYNTPEHKDWEEFANTTLGKERIVEVIPE